MDRAHVLGYSLGSAIAQELDAHAKLPSDVVRRMRDLGCHEIGIADTILERNGALVRELRDHHAKVAKAHPDLAEMIRLHGRAHEVPEV